MAAPPPAESAAALAERKARVMPQMVSAPLEMIRFGASALWEFRGVARYSSEIFRQISILITGTTFLILFMGFVGGNVCGVTGSYILKPLGAGDYTGGITSLCSTRGLALLMGSYILAAKIGTGLVAEVGSMRISDELDAFDSVGLSPMRFVVATRLAAMVLFAPFMYMLTIFAVDVGNYFGVVHFVGDISYGTWESVHFGIRNPGDYVVGIIVLFVDAVVVAIVALYYGYTARGGPVGVGRATAQSIVVNLVLVHAIYGLGNLIFFGFEDPGVSIGG